MPPWRNGGRGSGSLFPGEALRSLFGPGLATRMTRMGDHGQQNGGHREDADSVSKSSVVLSHVITSFRANAPMWSPTHRVYRQSRLDPLAKEIPPCESESRFALWRLSCSLSASC